MANTNRLLRGMAVRLTMSCPLGHAVSQRPPTAVAGQRGVVAVCQNADLLLLEANPLEKITNSRRIAGVMLRGRWLSRADIDTILAGLAFPN